MNIVTILAAAVSLSAPLLYAGLGELLSERGGILNLGLEGVMLIGAITGYMTGLFSGSLALGVLAALLTGALVGLIYAFFTVTMQANQVVCGLALVIVGSGISGLLGKQVYGHTSEAVFRTAAIPGLSEIPVLGPILFNHSLLVYALYLIIPIVTFYVYKTRPGLALRAVGENPAALDAMGFRVSLIRYVHVIIGCAMVSLGGAYITLAYTPNWNTGMTAGKGWIAVALVIFSGLNPLKVVLGAILFGAVEIIGVYMQVVGVNISSFIISMFPYICTVLVLIVSTGNFRKSRFSTPAALGKHYDREDR